MSPTYSTTPARPTVSNSRCESRGTGSRSTPHGRSLIDMTFRACPRDVGSTRPLEIIPAVEAARVVNVSVPEMPLAEQGGLVAGVVQGGEERRLQSVELAGAVVIGHDPRMMFGRWFGIWALPPPSRFTWPPAVSPAATASRTDAPTNRRR